VEIFELRKHRAMYVDKRIAALALNFLALLLAFAGLIVIIFFAPSGSFSFEMNLVGLILALTVIATGLTFYFQVSKA